MMWDYFFQLRQILQHYKTILISWTPVIDIGRTVNCKDSEKEPHDAWCNDADTYLKVGFLILYCILSWCDDGFQGSTFEFIWTKNCKKNFLKEIYTKKRKRWWKEKKIRVNLVGKMITFFVLLSGTAKKCFYFAERKMERKLKMDVKSNLDGDYIVKISSSKKGQYKPKSPKTLFL